MAAVTVSALAGTDPRTLPRSARLVAWGNAALLGHASLDDAVDGVLGPDTMHRVHGLAGDAVGLALALGRLRVEGVRGLRLVLPVPGDVAGLPGPPAFNGVAVQAGEAVLAIRPGDACDHPAGPGPAPYGLVPAAEALGSSGTAVSWRAYAVAPPRAGALPTLAEADRELAEAMRTATALLAALDVARADPEALDALARLREDAAADGLAPGYPARAHRVLHTARRVARIAAIAARGPGGAVSAGQIGRRAAALDPLHRASRRAVVAACNAVLEPGAR
jgi:hypothetical protein